MDEHGFTFNVAAGIDEIRKDPSDDLPYSIQWYEFLRGDDRYWSAKTYYVPGETATPAREAINGHRYRCTIGGRTAGAAPTWPTSGSTTVVDGGVTWARIGLEDRIASSAWTAETGITTASGAIDATECVTTIRLSGGTAGRDYIVTNVIVTDAGYDKSKRFRVLVRDQ
jgi:hypothetical protein